MSLEPRVKKPTSEPRAEGKLPDPKRSTHPDSKHSDDHEALWRNSNVSADVADPEQVMIARNKRIVELSFGWLDAAAQRKFRELRTDLEKEDEPDWFETLAGGVLEVAIGAGAAGVAARIAKRLVVGNDRDGMTEFVKVMFESGINAGISAGRGKLAAGKEANVIRPFIEAQEEGSAKTQNENQQAFVRTGQDEIRTLAQSQRLADACSHEHVKAAAQAQYEAARDAWLSYLAQTKYGARDEKGNAVSKDAIQVGKTTTNMQDQAARDRANKAIPGVVPEDAPSLAGDNPGVLTVEAKLPEIDLYGHQMAGNPVVSFAKLNGVSSKIREQYLNTPLSELKIPRLVVASVDGAPNFDLNLDEMGESPILPADKRTWLVRRATVAHPENGQLSDFEKYRVGIKLLLEQLKATKFMKLSRGPVIS